MANHQVSITENGTKTLLTEGKYCDRNIEVNVNVPNESTGITPTGTKNITTNGTHDVANYANANVNVPIPSGYIKPSGTKEITENGTYDVTSQANVNVNVATKPTQFTNILDLDTTIVKSGYRVTSTAYTATTDGVAIVCACAKGSHRLRVRGKYVFGFLQTSNATSTAAFYANFYQVTGTPNESTFAGTLIIDATTKSTNFGQDEYGDFYIEFTTTANGYIGFNLKDVSYNYKNGTFSGKPIITIDEPIGNGGVV